MLPPRVSSGPQLSQRALAVLDIDEACPAMVVQLVHSPTLLAGRVGSGPPPRSGASRRLSSIACGWSGGVTMSAARQMWRAPRRSHTCSAARHGV